MDEEYGDGGFDDFGDGEPMDVEAEVCFSMLARALRRFRRD